MRQQRLPCDVSFAAVQTRKKDMKTRFTAVEERWNCGTHAIGLIIGLIGFYFLFGINYNDKATTVGLSLNLFGMFASYFFSAVYHGCSPESDWKLPLRKCDHAAIYWHIAGAYSSMTLPLLHHSNFPALQLFSFVWLCAIVGTWLSFRQLKQHSHLKTVSYVAMGLSVTVAIKPLADIVTSEAMTWLIGEGVFYIVGATFYSLYRRRYMHTVFHLMVIGGTVCHLMVVWHLLTQMA